MRGIFVTGTDTSVVKTIVTGLLGRHFVRRGYNVITQKWIETGRRGFSGDVIIHLRLMGREKGRIKRYLPYMSPYTFGFPSSPHLAADLLKKRINAGKIKNSFLFLRRKFDIVLVEGTGGVLVPYNKKRLVIDIAKELNLAVLIVVGNKLGAINHTLLTLEALRKRDMNAIGVVFNNTDKKTDKVILRDNINTIKRLTQVKILGVLPYLSIKHIKRRGDVSLYCNYLSIKML